MRSVSIGAALSCCSFVAALMVLCIFLWNFFAPVISSFVDGTVPSAAIWLDVLGCSCRRSHMAPWAYSGSIKTLQIRPFIGVT
ncbi:hypothetical protein A2U01_0038692, partial [Trifolium medium]|nr:hypothetical protein [Trifolium medium]